MIKSLSLLSSQIHFYSSQKPTKIKYFYSYCEDDRYQKQDRNCWNGDVLGDYTHKIMDLHSQKYNPEVPIEKDAPSDTELHKINDQLVTMKNLVNKQVKKLLRKQFLLNVIINFALFR